MKDKTTQFLTSPLTWLVFLLISFLVVNPTAHATEQSFSIKPEEVEQAIKEQLESRGAGQDIKVTMVRKDPRTLYTGTLPVTFAVEKLNFNTKTSAWDAECLIHSGGHTLQTLALNGRYEEQVEVPAVNRRIMNGETITKADISWTSIGASRVHKDVITSAEELIGKSAKRPLSEDRPIRVSDVMSPIVIKRGDLVQVSFQTQNMTIQTMGRAQDNGAIGDAVSIKNADSGTLIHAVATGTKTAAVQSSIGAAANVASLQ